MSGKIRKMATEWVLLELKFGDLSEWFSSLGIYLMNYSGDVVSIKKIRNDQSLQSWISQRNLLETSNNDINQANFQKFNKKSFSYFSADDQDKSKFNEKIEA